MSASVHSLRRPGMSPFGTGRQLGELIEWTKLGPGGFPAGALQGLHSLGAAEVTIGQAEILPDVQQMVMPNGATSSFRKRVDEMFATLDGLEAQMNLEIDRILQGGGDVSDLQAPIVQAIRSLAQLHADSEQWSPGQGGEMEERRSLLEPALEDLLGKLIARRRNVEAGKASSAMLWGVGAAFAASAGLMWLWVNRRRSTRRRRR
jgi:hypothetical protein